MTSRKKPLANKATILFCPLNGQYKVIPARTSKKNLGTLTEEFASDNDRKPLITFNVVANDADPDDRYLVTAQTQADIPVVMFQHLKDMLAAENIPAMIPLVNKRSVVVTSTTTDKELDGMCNMSEASAPNPEIP